MKKRKSKVTSVDFDTAFGYPFRRAKGMWNIFWLLLPIFGWLALGGYSVRIVKEFSKGKFKKLPTMKFGSDMKLGFFMLIKSIPFILVYIILISILTAINFWAMVVGRIFVEVFVIPILTINFMNKETVGSLFEFKLVKSVFNNLEDYVVTVLRSILLFVVYLIMVLILVGIPAMFFTNYLFLADFYRRMVK